MRKCARVWLGLAVALGVGIVAVSLWTGDVGPAKERVAMALEKGQSAEEGKPSIGGGIPVEKPRDRVATGAVAPDPDEPAPLPAGNSEPSAGKRSDRSGGPVDPPPDARHARRVLDDLHFALRDYRTAVGGNPVGTNAEITSALLGNNARQAKVALPDGATVNGLGEMCDPWGTPYFFHQLSGTRMEVRSAGPDRRMWTEDDVAM